MKVVGVIAEFNPVHNGHIYFLNEVRKRSKCDCLVLCLSSYTTMRGDVAVLDPMERIYPILDLVDIVFTLPVSLVNNSADIFAFYAVKSLADFKVTKIYYGVEELFDFNKILLSWEENQAKIKEKIKEGLSFKKATHDILNLQSNQLLGFFYELANLKLNLNIKFNYILRLGNYTNTIRDNTYVSSSEIRKDLSLLTKYAPKQKSLDFLFLDNVYNYLKLLLLLDDSNLEIANLIRKHTNSNSLGEFLNKASNKTYTKTKIKRYLISLLFKLDNNAYEYKYKHVIYFSKNGQIFLNKYKRELTYITKLNPKLDKLSFLEFRAFKIYQFLQKL